jgi:hypothetical protein
MADPLDTATHPPTWAVTRDVGTRCVRGLAR